MKIKCLIAKINIEFDILSKKIYQELEKYEVTNEPDFFITSVLEDELVLPLKEPSIVGKYYKIYKEGNTLIQAQYGEKENLIGIIEYCENKAVLHFTKNNTYYDEFLLSDYALVYFVLKNQNAIFIHSSCLAYKDNGILLIANSGTGKSTHANLWSQYEDVIRVNDDKNFIILEDGELKVYANPYSGKHLIHTNTCVKLTHLVFLHQSKENVARELSTKEKFFMLLPHIMNTSFILSREKWDLMTNELVKVKGISLGCNISQEAVETLKNSL